jgi:hypothetical protein
MLGHLGPVSGKHLTGERIDFDLTNGPHTDGFEAEVEPADTAERGQYGKRHRRRGPSIMS